MDAKTRYEANKREILRLRQKLKAQVKANELEMLFLQQAITAKAIQQQLDESPKVEWVPLAHNHECVYCHEVWTDQCDDHAHDVRDHGCDAEIRFRKAMAIMANAPDKWQEPYLSRYQKRRGPSPDDKLRQKMAANDAEIARLRKELGI